MRSLTLAAAFGITGLVTASSNGHHHRALAHRHAHLHARDYAATETEVLTEWVTKYVYEDGSPATPPSTSSTSSLASTSSNSTTLSKPTLEPGIFIQKETSSTAAVPSTTPTPTPVVPTPPPPPPAETIAPTRVVAPSPPPPAQPTDSFPLAPGERAFTLINSHSGPISTGHDDTIGTPTSAGQPVKAGTIAPGATATWVVQEGWIGNVVVNDANFELTPNSTLIEANYSPWNGPPYFGAHIPDVDVSFVNGFTLPITCKCNGQVTSGCNIDLSSIMSCPGGTQNNACANPLRASFSATSAADFFKPCEGAAWTFVNDGNADSNCPQGDIVCCVGTSCDPNPKQGAAK